MNDVQARPDTTPLLRTLAPALRGRERTLRQWLDGPRRYPVGTITRATLEGLADDLGRQAAALDVDRPLLVIMLMGGTGVGKSTLLNALAGGQIAQASFTRPTTRDPVVYYHESIRTDRLDPALRQCRLAPHDRPSLEHKILVDTPDLDSNDLANRDKLMQVLPVADVVLYVGSQEKYHDQLGWELFKQQRKRRAFAFVLNKWDRCVQSGAAGLRPDEDLARDLAAEGFQNPLIFRTCSQLWVDHAAGVRGQGPGAREVKDINQKSDVGSQRSEDTNEEEQRRNGDSSLAPDPRSLTPAGEQFPELVTWLEMGLTRLEIEAIKARGVGQLLHQLEHSLEAAAPPDVTETARQVRAAWDKPLADEAAATADVLLTSLDPYQREIEHHFAREGVRRFHGIMAAYLGLVTRLKYAGSSLTSHIPIIGRSSSAASEPPPADLTTFTRACAEVASNRQLDARNKALANRLLVEADAQGFPLNVLSEPVEAVGRLDWRQRYSRLLGEVLQQVERQWTNPVGPRAWVHKLIVFLADWLPPVTVLAAVVLLLWNWFAPFGGEQRTPQLTDVFVPLVVLAAVIALLHVLISLLLPLRWAAIRDEFGRQLRGRLLDEIAGSYAPVPGDVAEALAAERRRIEQQVNETREIASWLTRREQSASITGLYGS